MFEQEIIKWAEERGIFDKATTLSQHRKTKEEVEELEDALGEADGAVGRDDSKYRRAMADVKDAIGDIYVTLVIQAHMNGLTMSECVGAAYEEISGRTGEMVNGMFVKDGD